MTDGPVIQLLLHREDDLSSRRTDDRQAGDTVQDILLGSKNIEFEYSKYFYLKHLIENDWSSIMCTVIRKILVKPLTAGKTVEKLLFLISIRFTQFIYGNVFQCIAFRWISA